MSETMEATPVNSMSEALDAWKLAHEISGRKDEELAKAKAEKDFQEMAEKEAADRQKAERQAAAIAEARTKARDQREAEAAQLLQEARENRLGLDAQRANQAPDFARQTSMCEALDTWRADTQRLEEEDKANAEASVKLEREDMAQKKIEEDATRAEQHRLRIERADTWKAKATEDAKLLLAEAKLLAAETKKQQVSEASTTSGAVSSPSEALDDWNDASTKNS